MPFVVRGDRYRPGDWLVRCDRTGFKLYASECRLEWNNLFVRRESWEPRHPQDFVRGRADNQTVPIPRPDDEEPTFLGTNEVKPEDL